MGCLTQKEDFIVLIKLIFIGGISVASSLVNATDDGVDRELTRTPIGSPSRPISVAPDDSFHAFLDKYENLIADRLLQAAEDSKVVTKCHGLRLEMPDERVGRPFVLVKKLPKEGRKK